MIDTTAHRKPTWKALVKTEPRLAVLLKEAQSVDGSGARFCANRVWYGYGKTNSFKDRVCRLVGWEAGRCVDPMLKTQGAYDVAYDKIYDALPDCRDCVCIRVGVR